MPVLLLSLFFVLTQNVAPQRVDPNWLFVRDALVWKSPEKSSRVDYTYADSADIAVFSPTGEFALVSCVLCRDNKTGHLSLVPNEGYTLRKGIWKRENTHSLIVRASYVYLSAPVKEIPIPSPEVEERWLMRGRSKGRLAAVFQVPDINHKGGVGALRSRVGSYIPLRKLSNTDSLSNIVAFGTQN
jgi:hypothetical protein